MHFCKDCFWSIYLRMQNVLPQALNSTLNIAPGGRCNSLALPSLTAPCVLDQVQNAASCNDARGKITKPKTNKQNSQTTKKTTGKNPYMGRHQFNC